MPQSLEAASRTAEINYGYMSTIVYDGGLRPKLIFIDKMRNYDFFNIGVSKNSDINKYHY